MLPCPCPTMEILQNISFQLTHINFMATSLKPLVSNRLMISPTSPRWTPSGLTMMKVCSRVTSPDMVVLEGDDDEEQVSKSGEAEVTWVEVSAVRARRRRQTRVDLFLKLDAMPFLCCLIFFFSLALSFLSLSLSLGLVKYTLLWFAFGSIRASVS